MANPTKDRLTEIEDAIAVMLMKIDGHEANPAKTDYVYFNKVKYVNLDNEALISDPLNYPIIDTFLFNDERPLSADQMAYKNEVTYELRCKVANVLGVDDPRREINKRMNELLSDIKCAIALSPTLNGTCDMVTYAGSPRDKFENGTDLRAGNLIVYLDIEYTQSRLNPLLNCSY